MGQIFEAMVNFFEAEDWSFYQVKEKVVLRMNIAARNGDFHSIAKADDEDEYLMFFSVCPVKAPEEKRLALADFLTKANYGLRLGNFEMDFDEGEIRYKTSANFQGYELKSAMIEHLVYANVGTMDKYLPGIMKVMYGGISPEEAIDQIENQEE